MSRSHRRKLFDTPARSHPSADSYQGVSIRAEGWVEFSNGSVLSVGRSKHGIRRKDERGRRSTRHSKTANRAKDSPSATKSRQSSTRAHSPTLRTMAARGPTYKAIVSSFGVYKHRRTESRRRQREYRGENNSQGWSPAEEDASITKEDHNLWLRFVAYRMRCTFSQKRGALSFPAWCQEYGDSVDHADEEIIARFWREKTHVENVAEQAKATLDQTAVASAAAEKSRQQRLEIVKHAWRVTKPFTPSNITSSPEMHSWRRKSLNDKTDTGETKRTRGQPQTPKKKQQDLAASAT